MQQRQQDEERRDDKKERATRRRTQRAKSNISGGTFPSLSKLRLLASSTTAAAPAITETKRSTLAFPPFFLSLSTSPSRPLFL